LSNPEASLTRLLSGHREATLSRCAKETLVFAIQDTTSLNYTGHPATEGLGHITSVSDSLGLEVHSLMAVNASGTPLGLLDIQAWARNRKDYGQSEERDKRAAEAKESQKWLKGYAAADAAAKRLEPTKVVVVADREADMFDLFVQAAQGSAHLLVRATHPRRLLTPEGEVEGLLWDCVRQEPAAGTLEVNVPRRGSRAARTARLELRYREVRICQPLSHGGPRKARKSVKAWAVAATETKESAGAIEPLEWLLLTTVSVDSLEAAAEKVQWYTQRWQIEVFHRTLKTGCGVEHRQAKTAHSLEASLAIDAVVAWRVMWLVKLGRETPDVPCSTFFEEHEWKALYCFVNQTNVPPSSPPSLDDAVRKVARLGGFLGRKGDGHPGAQTVWQGMERLTDIAAAFLFFFPVPRGPTCG